MWLVLGQTFPVMRFAWSKTICKATVMASARARQNKGFYASLNQISTMDILPNCLKRKKTSKGSFYKVDRLIASRILSSSLGSFSILYELQLLNGIITIDRQLVFQLLPVPFYYSGRRRRVLKYRPFFFFSSSCCDFALWTLIGSRHLSWQFVTC